MSNETSVVVNTQRLTLTFCENRGSYSSHALAVLFAELASLYSRIITDDKNLTTKMMLQDPLEVYGENITNYLERFYDLRNEEMKQFFYKYIKDQDEPIFEDAFEAYIQCLKTNIDFPFRDVSPPSLGFIGNKTISTGILNLQVCSINYNSPMSIVLQGSMAVLILTIAVAGGEISYRNGEFTAKTPGIVEAINTIQSSKLDEIQAILLFEETLKQKNDTKVDKNK